MLAEEPIWVLFQLPANGLARTTYLWSFFRVVMLSEEHSYEYYYCYVLLSADNILVVVFLTRRGGGGHASCHSWLSNSYIGA